MGTRDKSKDMENFDLCDIVHLWYYKSIKEEKIIIQITRNQMPHIINK